MRNTVNIVSKTLNQAKRRFIVTLHNTAGQYHVNYYLNADTNEICQ